MDLIRQLVDLVLHLDVHLNEWAATLGPWTYALLFTVIFCETGLVVTPFLPGDSLLFAVGALAATDGSPLSLPLLAVTLMLAAILGDAANYSIGKYIGPKVFTQTGSRWLNRAHLVRTQQFYERHGGKTIILAQYMPIIRTFAPFVAGIGKMTYRRFAAFNVVGAVSWVGIFLCAGYFFGNIPTVKRNFHIVIFGIIFVSLIPIAAEFISQRRQRRRHA
jgi:membrane-associated protein